MTKKDIQLLVELLSLQTTYTNTDEFDDWFLERQKSYGKDVLIEKDKKGNTYITKGTADTYPCVVAHTDRVCSVKEKERHIIHVGENLVAFNENVSQIDVFGDDTSGVFVAIKMLETLPVIKVCLFVEEESGCKGSKEANMNFFANARFVLQADRNHQKADFITHTNGIQSCSENFVEACKPYMIEGGYAEARGTSTDVGQLVHNGLKCCAVNLSAGYFNAHSSKGYINIPLLDQCTELVKNICINLTDTYELIKPVPIVTPVAYRPSLYQELFNPTPPANLGKGKNAWLLGWSKLIDKITTCSDTEYANILIEFERQREIEREGG